MNETKRNDVFNKYVNAKEPKVKKRWSLPLAFLVGGIICVFGQFIKDFLLYVYPSLTLQDASTYMLIIIIAITVFLTGIGVFDRIGRVGGAGSFIPITGFANAVASPAIEFKNEGYIFGLAVKIFTVAGPIIVNGVSASVIVGIIYYLFM